MKKKSKFGFIFLFISIALLSLSFFKLDPDYYWHIKTGEYIFKNGIFTKDIFSWFTLNKYWMCHEWLFDCIIYLFKVIFGSFHIFIYCFINIVLILLCLFIPNRKNLNKNITFSLFYIFLFLIILFFVQTRPHMFSYVLLSLTLYSLFDLSKNEDSKIVYILPIISIIWSNFHGGSSNLVYLLCFIFIVCGLFNFKFNKIEANRFSKKQFKKYFIIMICCMICTCINIHGFKMFIYPYINMANSTMLTNITEWRNTSLSVITDYVYYLLVIFIVFILLISKKKIRFVDFVLFGFFVYLSLKSIRFWFFTYIVSSFFIFDYVSKKKEDNMDINCLYILGCLFLFISIFNFKNIFNINISDGLYLSKSDIKEIKKYNPERLFNMYDYGGELIYNDIKVFIDGRADLYTDYNYSDYLKMSVLKGDYVKLIDKYNFDYFLVDKRYPIYYYLKYSDDYKIIYKNKNVILFKDIKKEN